MIKKLSLVVILLTLLSCSKDYKFDELDYNIYSGAGRTNSYEHFGKFPLQLAVAESIVTADSSGVIQTALRLKSPFNVIANSKGKILRVNNSHVDIIFTIDSNFVVASGMTADRNSNIYFITSDDKIYCIDFNFNLKWKNDIPVQKSRSLSFSDLISVNDGIIVGANTGELLKYDFNGNVVWKFKSNLAVPKTFSADSTDNLYIPFTNNEFGATDSLICINKSGNTVWQTALSETRILSSSAYRNGKIYITGGKLKLNEKVGMTYCIDKTGKIIWSKETPLAGRFISVDYDNNCYVSCISSGVGEIKTGLFAFDSKGKQLWNYYYGAAAVSPLLISEKYLGFTGFTGEGAAIYFVRKDDGLMVKFHSLSNFPPLYLQPMVSDDSSIKLFGSSKLMLVKFSETILEKILP
jgi:outer membrane protein assembly factor BamB